LAHPYTLIVHDDLEERQIRRLGAAVRLLWKDLPPSVQSDLVTQATMIHISGESTKTADLRVGILDFLASGALSNTS
jgi:hypothetical protein